MSWNRLRTGRETPMGMDEPQGVHTELVDRVLRGDGHAPRDLRQAAFDNSGPADERVRPLVEKVASQPAEISEADYAAARQAGLSDDQLWELVICAAVGQAARQYQGALDALGEVIKEQST